MEFYILIDNMKHGPYPLEELVSKNITAETLVWTVGMEQWTPAWQVDELKPLLTNRPPEVPRQQAPKPTQTQRIPKTWLVESILVTLFCCLPFGIAGIVNSSKVESLYRSGAIDQAQHASDQAKKWTYWAFFCGLGFYIIYIGIFLVAFIAGASF